MKQYFTLAFLAFALICKGYVSAQTGLKADSTKAAADSAKFYPCLHNPHNREFDYWIGSWDVYATGTTQLVGHSVVQQASGGCMILENWTALVNEDGKSINFIDVKTGKWEQNWVGSGGQAQRFINGVYKNNVMVFEGSTQNKAGAALTVRFSFFNIDPNKVRQLYETSKDGATWATGYDLTYLRKK
jgi:hypothetical protein